MVAPSDQSWGRHSRALDADGSYDRGRDGARSAVAVAPSRHVGGRRFESGRPHPTLVRANRARVHRCWISARPNTWHLAPGTWRLNNLVPEHLVPEHLDPVRYASRTLGLRARRVRQWRCDRLCVRLLPRPQSDEQCRGRLQQPGAFQPAPATGSQPTSRTSSYTSVSAAPSSPQTGTARGRPSKTGGVIRQTSSWQRLNALTTCAPGAAAASRPAAEGPPPVSSRKPGPTGLAQSSRTFPVSAARSPSTTAAPAP